MQNFINIPTDESQDVYSEIDNPYFPPGKTPKYVYVSFSGIRPGDRYDPVEYLYSVPSGTWKLVQLNAAVWIYDKENFRAYVVVDYFGIIAGINYYFDDFFIEAFFSNHEDWLYFSDINWYDIPDNNHFYDGQMSVAWFTESDPNNIAQVADRIGFERSKKAFYQGIPQSATETTYRFARRSDHSRILVKVDKSA